MFKNTRILIEQYFFHLYSKKQSTKRAEHLLQEIRGRLRQLQSLYTRIENLVAVVAPDIRTVNEKGQGKTIIHMFSDSTPPEKDPLRLATLKSKPHDDLRCDVEYFYYCAHRIQDIISDSKNDLPGLIRFKAKGVTMVRNNLVEHPARKNGVIVYSYIVGLSGPKLRPLRWSLDEPGAKDPGLWVNAAEFEKLLNESLEAGISNKTL